MDIKIYPRKLSGTVKAIPSKSQTHRLLICAAFADSQTKLICPQTNRDIEATAACLRSLGADIVRCNDGYVIKPISIVPETAVLPCGESGSTLRFMLPIVGALGVDAQLQMEGRLPERPLSPLWEEMERMGCVLTRPERTLIRCQRKLSSGSYKIDGGVSSQFITGLLFALSLLKEDSIIHVTGKMESKPYISMTQRAMEAFGVQTKDYRIEGNQVYHSPGTLNVEGDWSNGAFFLTAKSIGNEITVENLDPDSPQGDRAVASILPALSENCTISAADIPDLVPILSVAASVNQGCTFTDIERLRLKESDRVATVVNMLGALGIRAEASEHTLTVFPGQLQGGTVDAVNDHRIAMAAGIAATLATGPVTILGAQCVAKSYPAFWDEYARLGGNYEQYIR